MPDGGVLVDTSIVLYALGGPGTRRQPCRAFLQRMWEGSGRAYASTEMFQEALHHRLRRVHRDTALATIRRLLPRFVVLDFDHEVLALSLELIERTEVRGRDAVHAATALAYGIQTIASADPAFDVVPAITRIDPSSLGALPEQVAGETRP